MEWYLYTQQLLMEPIDIVVDKDRDAVGTSLELLIWYGVGFAKVTNGVLPKLSDSLWCDVPLLASKIIVQNCVEDALKLIIQFGC